MHTKFFPQPSHSGTGVLSLLGLALFRLPVRGAASAQASQSAQGRHSVRDAARQLSAWQEHERHAGARTGQDAALCDINQVLRRMVRIARTLVPAGVRIAERYATLEQTGEELPEFHQVVLHLILDAAQAVGGCGTIDVASRCVAGEVCISISDSRASKPASWGLMAPLMGTPAKRHEECSSLGLLMAGDFADEHGGRVSTARTADGGNVVTMVFPLTQHALV